MKKENYFINALIELYGFGGRWEKGIIEVVENGAPRAITGDELAAITILANEMLAEYNDNEYLRDIKKELPSVEDQLEMMYNDEINNTKTWCDSIKAIKDKHKPKKQ